MVKEVWQAAAGWLSKQDANTVMTFTVLFALLYGLHIHLPAMFDSIEQRQASDRIYFSGQLQLQRDHDREMRAQIREQLTRSLDELTQAIRDNRFPLRVQNDDR